MEKKQASIGFQVSFTPKKKINEEFTLCRCSAFGLGKNRNFSHVSKENLDRCKDTLSYAPVVGHIIDKYDKDGNKVGSYMGGHDYYITDDWEFKPATVPYGVVVADSFEYETIDEYADGQPREYLMCDVILWTGRYPELLDCIYSEDVWFNESAELSVSEYRPLEEDSNYTDLTDFTFSALCLLGKADDKNSEEHTEPCFIESKVTPKQFSFETDEFAKVMGELKQELAFYFNNSKEGGTNSMNHFEELLAKYGKTVEDIDFEYENLSDEELDAKFAELFEEGEPEGAESEPTEEPASEGGEPEGEPTEEPESAESAESTEPAEPSEYELLQAEFEEYKNSHSHTNEEYDVLAQYKADAEFAKEHTVKANLLAEERFAVLAENEAFAKLIAEMDNYSVEELEREAKVILADYMINGGTFAKADMSQINKKQFAIVEKTKKKSSRYGGMFDN